jgi:PPM family protein phosphatase
MEFKGKAYNHKGLVRNTNEDHILIAGNIFSDGETDFHIKNAPAVFAVADGLGGHNAGEVASHLLLEHLVGWFEQADYNMTFEAFADSIGEWADKMNESLKAQGLSQQSLAGMGTTLAGVFLAHTGVFSFNAGDSRVYLFNNGNLTRITTDHTVKGASGNRMHILTNCIGASITTFIDCVDITPHLCSKTSIMICSDGLTDMVEDAELRDCLEKGNYDCMLQIALQNGGKDNISYIIIEVV